MGKWGARMFCVHPEMQTRIRSWTWTGILDLPLISLLTLASYLSSVYLRLLICKTGVIVKDRRDDQMKPCLEGTSVRNAASAPLVLVMR